MGGSLMELSAFMEKQQAQAEAREAKLEERMEKLRQEAKTERAEQREYDAQLRQEAKAEKAELEANMEARIQKQREHDERVKAETEAKMEQLRQDTKAEKGEMEAKMEQLKTELKAELTLPPPAAAITQEQLAALQSRIEGLHVAKLLADEELFTLEDMIADYVELTMSVTDGRVITREMIYTLPTVAAASKLDKLVGLSSAMVGDAAFARQARRKFL